MIRLVSRLDGSLHVEDADGAAVDEVGRVLLHSQDARDAALTLAADWGAPCLVLHAGPRQEEWKEGTWAVLRIDAFARAAYASTPGDAAHAAGWDVKYSITPGE